MTEFTESDDLRGARFYGVDLREAHIAESDLSGAVLRGVEVRGLEIDAPWLADHDGRLWINGVDVVPFVEAELDRRFPGREQRHAEDAVGLRSAWEVLQETWATTIGRAAGLREGAVDESVGGEWSFALTLRHLVYATDLWFRQSVLQMGEDAIHPIGVRHGRVRETKTLPPFADVLAARADRVTQVRAFLTDVTDAQLGAPRQNPHDPARAETVRSCLHVVLEEEWEHLRFATRDLAALAEPSGRSPV